MENLEAKFEMNTGKNMIQEEGGTVAPLLMNVRKRKTNTAREGSRLGDRFSSCGQAIPMVMRSSVSSFAELAGFPRGPSSPQHDRRIAF